MMYEFTDDQKMMQEMVREFTANEIAPIDRQMDEEGFSWDLHKKMAEAGIMGMAVDEEFGGSGIDAVTKALVTYEVGKGSGSAGLFLDANWLGADILYENGSDEQKAKYLPEAAEGAIFAFGLTEASAGTDAGGIKSTAVKDGDDWILSGGKAWITNSGIADYYILLALTDPEKGNRGISAFLVSKDQEGFKIGKEEDKMGCRGTMTTSISYDRMRLPGDALVGEENKGFVYAMQALDQGRVSVGALAAGISEHAMELAKRYANERKTFGRPIGSYQLIQRKFAIMDTLLEAMKLMTIEAATKADSGERYTVEAARCKLFAGEAALYICKECIQIFGGYGYSKEYDVERMYRDARLLTIGEGTSEILELLIGGTYIKG